MTKTEKGPALEPRDGSSRLIPLRQCIEAHANLMGQFAALLGLPRTAAYPEIAVEIVNLTEIESAARTLMDCDRRKGVNADNLRRVLNKSENGMCADTFTALMTIVEAARALVDVRDELPATRNDRLKHPHRMNQAFDRLREALRCLATAKFHALCDATEAFEP